MRRGNEEPGQTNVPSQHTSRTCQTAGRALCVSGPANSGSSGPPQPLALLAGGGGDTEIGRRKETLTKQGCRPPACTPAARRGCEGEEGRQSPPPGGGGSWW